jgi:hypothetical protein
MYVAAGSASYYFSGTASPLRYWSRTHAEVFIIRPHTGVPEIGRLINTSACSDQGSAPTVVSSQSSRRLLVAHNDGSEASKRMLTDRFLVLQYEGGQHTLTRP